MPDGQDAMLRRIQALLAKAESTTFPEEAEALAAKAQELITRHSIDAALLQAAGGGGPGEAGRRRLRIVGPYIGPKALLLGGIATANRCRVVWSSEGHADVFGFDQDIDAVELVWVSLLTHAVAEVARIGKGGDARARSKSYRRSFLIAFATRVQERLTQAAARATEAAAGADLLPVLAARDDAVERALRAAHPRTRKASFSVRDAAGWHAGRDAADGADLGDRGRLPR